MNKANENTAFLLSPEPTYTVRFAGEITARTGFSTLQPDTGSRRSEGPQPVPRMPMVRNGEIVEVPYIPAGQLKNRLRYSAVSIIIDCLRKNKAPTLPLDDVYALYVGGLQGKGEETDRAHNVSVEAEVRHLNPIFSLFGSFRPDIPGRSGIEHAIPSMRDYRWGAVAVVSGIRKDPLVTNPSLREILSEDDQQRHEIQIRNQGRRSKINAELKKLSKEGGSSPSPEQQAAIEALKAELVEIESTAVARGISIQMPYSGYEAIPAGSILPHGMVLRGVTAAEAGLFIAALRRTVLDPYMGAHFAHGAGLIDRFYDVSVIGETGQRLIGRLELPAFGPSSWANAQGDDASRFENAWEQKRQTLTRLNFSMRHLLHLEPRKSRGQKQSSSAAEAQA